MALIAELPAIEPQPSFDYLLARSRYPDLFRPHPGEVIAELPIGFVERLIGLLTSISTIEGAGMEPSVRAIQALNNLRSPNVTPGPSDLVRFELREVFRDEDRATQLKEPASQQFKDAMRRQGFSDFWADSYWAAHWELPSPLQGFEMFQRLRPGRVPASIAFTEDDLRKLLKKQDVLSEYRDRLVAIAYAPLTRVDVRRMFQLGVLTEAEMVEAYKDLGYDSTNAARLAAFTKKDTDPDEKAISVSILNDAYLEGTITGPAWDERVRKLGYADDSVEILGFLLDAKKQKQDQRAAEAKTRKLNAIKLRTRRQSRAGKMDEELLRLELADLDLSPVEVESFVVANAVPVADKNAEITKADVLSALTKGVVSRAEAERRLAALGFDAQETAILIETRLTAAKKK